MDWTKIRRRKIESDKSRGVYTRLDDLVRIQFAARDFSFLPRQPVTGILSGRYTSRLRGRGLNFEELRRYLPGDDVRNIDWKVSARYRSPYVRVYTEEKDRSVLLVLDQRINMFFGTREKLKSVTAAQAAALAAWRAVDVGDRVGAIIFNDVDMEEIQPRRSSSAVMSILSAITHYNHALTAEYEHPPNAGVLNHALRAAARLITHDTLVIIVSDFFGVDQQTEHFTAELAQHNDILGVLVHDPIRLKPIAQKILVTDGDAQMEIDFGDARTRQHVLQDYQLEQEHIAHTLRKLSAPLLMISNEGDVVEQVRSLLGVAPRARRAVHSR